MTHKTVFAALVAAWFLNGLLAAYLLLGAVYRAAVQDAIESSAPLVIGVTALEFVLCGAVLAWPQGKKVAK